MTRTPSRRPPAVLLAVCLAAALFSGGCSAKLAEQGRPVASTPTDVTGVQIPRMTPAEKRSLIASSFPIEAPVPAGRVVRGEAQGEDVWDYQLEVAAGVGDVANWYATWFQKADWQLVGDEPAGEGRKLTFVKGAAEFEAVMTPSGAGQTSVAAVLGVGAPVLNTQ